MKSTRKVEPVPTYNAAVLTIRNASTMPANHIRDIADWLEEQARHLRSDSENYSKRFTARYVLDINPKSK